MHQLFRRSPGKDSHLAISGEMPIRKPRSKSLIKDGTANQSCSGVYHVFLNLPESTLRMYSVGKYKGQRGQKSLG